MGKGGKERFMSWGIYLQDKDGNCFTLAIPHTERGIYAIGGTTNTELNVTYNYGRKFDFKNLHKRTGRETIPELEKAVKELAKGPDDSNGNQLTAM